MQQHVLNLDGAINTTLLFLRDFLKFRYTQTVGLEEWKLPCAPRVDCEEPQVTLTTHPLCRARREEAVPPGRGARDPVSLESETRTHSSHYSAEPRCRDHETQSDCCVACYGHECTTLTDAYRWKLYFLEAVLFFAE